MAVSAQSLFTAAGCFSCLGPVDNAQTMRIGLLLNILTELGVTMTPQELMDEAACYSCLPGVSQGDAIELALLNEISEGIAGSSGGAAVPVSGNPNGVTTADNLQFGWDAANDVLWIHEGADGTSNNWVQIV